MSLWGLNVFVGVKCYQITLCILIKTVNTSRVAR